MNELVRSDWLNLDYAKFETVSVSEEIYDLWRQQSQATIVYKHIETDTFWAITTMKFWDEHCYIDNENEFVAIADCTYMATPEANFDKRYKEGKIKQVYPKLKTITIYE